MSECDKIIADDQRLLAMEEGRQDKIVYMQDHLRLQMEIRDATRTKARLSELEH